MELADLAAELGVRFHAAMASLPQLPSEFSNAVAREVPGDGDGWLGRAALSAVLAIAIGYAAARLFEHYVQKAAKPAPQTAEGFDTNTRIAFLLRRLLVWVIGSAILVGVGFLVLQVLDKGVPIERRTALIPLVCVGIARSLLSVFRTLFTPALPQYRLVHVDTQQARALYRDFAIFVVAAAVIAGFDWWLEVLSLPAENRSLVAISLSLVLVILISAVCIAHRRMISYILVAPGSTINPLIRGLARMWWILAVAYFLLGWGLRCVNVLLGIKGGSGLVTTPLMLLVVGLIAYGVARLVLAKIIKQGTVLRVGTGAQARRLRDYLDLAYDAAAWVLVFACFVDIARAWGVTFESGGMGSIIVKVGLILVAGAVLYDGVRIAIDRKLAVEGGMGAVYADENEDDESPIRTGQSRIATLLPLIRVFVLSIIASLIAMMVLSELGVQVAPLLAGASIFGLAIGFGSQTLVHDVLSGAFFLVDDAFRVGEYVDLGGGIKGTVEKISIRSFQLRHQNGPLHTVQFGNIKQVTNFSRDWALSKIPFQFALGTDIEKVRKIVKRVGQELATDPATAHLFLMPLKSQGVSQVSGNGVTVRVKFMTSPMDTSMATRVVLARLHQAFLEAKLEFPNTAMTVRIENSGPALTPEQESQAVAAALAQQQAAAAVATPG